MATTMTMRFPHTAPRSTGVTTLTPTIVRIRMVSFMANIIRGDIRKADVIIKDTIRLFRTAKVNMFDHLTYKYIFQNLLHVAVELRMEKYSEVIARLENVSVSLSLPDSLY